MSNSLVAYFSLTGNTQKVAEAIYQALECEKELFDIKQETGLQPEDFDLIFIGFPVHSHSIPYKVEQFLRNLPTGIKIALFSTHGSLTGGRLSREALEYAASLAARMKILGTFSCRGKVSPQAMEILQKSPEHTAWAEMAVSAQTHPDEHDLEDARSFALRTQTLAGHSR